MCTPVLKLFNYKLKNNYFHINLTVNTVSKTLNLYQAKETRRLYWSERWPLLVILKNNFIFFIVVGFLITNILFTEFWRNSIGNLENYLLYLWFIKVLKLKKENQWHTIFAKNADWHYQYLRQWWAWQHFKTCKMYTMFMVVYCDLCIN